MTQWCFNTLISNGRIIKIFFCANRLEQTEKNQIKMKVTAMRAKHSYFSNEQIYKKHRLKNLMTSAAKKLPVNN